MKILCVGDVVGSVGCEYFESVLPKIKREYNIDLVIVNGENSADGNGMLPRSAERLLSAGAFVITGGNHSFGRREIYDELETNNSIIRPANMPSSAPGKGFTVIDCGRVSVGVLNLCGTVFMENLDCPFKTADLAIEEMKKLGAKIILVDFHAEATSEKRALAFYLDGRISALFGTHTHVQTADEQILPYGTGYITDLGMTGPIDSVLGVKKEIVINRFKDHLPARFETASGECSLGGAIFTVDEKAGICEDVLRICI